MVEISVRGMEMPSARQLIHATLRENLQIFSLRPIERDVETCPYRGSIGAASRPFILPWPDQQLDSRLLNVDPYFDCRIQIERGKNIIVDSVVLASNAIHGLDLHGFALSTETRLAIRYIAYLV